MRELINIREELEILRNRPINYTQIPLSQKIEENSKEIENTEDKSALLSENKINRNKENIKHL